MTIVLFAIIGAMLNTGTAYWICFSVMCLFRLIQLIAKITEE